MDFRYTTEQDLYRQSIREWLTKNLEPRAREIDENEDGSPVFEKWEIKRHRAYA